MNKAELQDLLNQDRLHRVADGIMALAQPAIRIKPRPADESGLAIGISKMGGLPDLPEGVDWPQWHEPMAFIGQFNLADINTFNHGDLLPESGLLSFFYETNGEPLHSDELEGRQLSHEQAFRGWKIVYSEIQSTLVRLKRPDYENVLTFPACVVEFSEAWTIPRVDSPELSPISLTMSERNAYIDLEMDVNRGDFGEHQLLGHGFWLDSIPFLMAADRQSEWTSAKPERRRAIESEIKSRWIMLLQVSSSDELQMDWAGGGLLHYSIEREALRQHDFARVWVDIDFL
jgi:uncharacterized protein YwqG